MVKGALRSSLASLGLLEPARIVRGSLRLATPALVAGQLRYCIKGAPDGWPLPPVRLVWLVIGHGWLPIFWDSGRQVAAEIQANLERAGYPLGRFRSILEFGCGCGRILRHFRKATNAKLSGTDYNTILIDWCRRSLPGIVFSTNGLGPPLLFEDGAFDLAFAQSVFTHLDADLQRQWMAELRRVLKSGGILHLTTQGDVFLNALSPEERVRYAEGELVVHAAAAQGENLCGAFQNRSNVERSLLDGFEILLHVPGREVQNLEQDAYVLRKR